VRKIDFPRLAVPMSVLIGALINVGLNLIPVFAFLFASGGTPRLAWLELLLVIGWIAMFAFGIGMLLSSLFIRFRDIEPIWDVILQAMFYASGIFFSLDTLGGKKFLGINFSQHDLSTGVMSNPFAAALQQARHAVVDPSYLSASHSIGGWDYMLIPLGVTVVLLVLGFLVFRRIAPTIAEDL
jgi:ABC-2 type transport system permease protein